MKDEFFKNVHEVAKLIPVGRVSTYGAIGTYLGAKKSARIVGYAMNAAHGDSSIPAHRVVNRVGLLTGKMHFETPETMERKLRMEGIVVVDDQVQDFDKYFWDPNVELL